ncbi:MAG: restriction endonuclease subunit S [Saprospiraceae bacterium]|nr:restriction endonuclease subunit S [Saprospiraceae bacterium]
MSDKLNQTRSEWKQVALVEITTKVTDGAHHSPSEFKDGFPMFSVKDMREQGFYFKDSKKISEKDFKKLVSSGCQPEIDDILIAKDGSVLKHIFKVKERPNYVLLSSIAIVRPNKKLIDPSFLVYAIKEPSTKEFILTNFVGGSGVPRIVLKDFKQIEISLPPLPEQTAIAAVLSSLDDKIDLLHRQNQTLEALAETLFKQWFVEEAKEEWESMPLSKMANFLNGLACQKFPPKNEIEKLPVLKIKELSSGITENSDWATTDVKPEYIVKNGDVIFAWSASLMVKIWNGQDCILNQHLFKVTSDNFPKWFYFLWCKHHLAEFISIAASHATTMGHIKRGDLDEAMVLIPSKHELEKMTEKVEPLIEKIISNQSQIRTLTQLRDTLLPKLMSGEIRVKIE